MLNAPWSRTAVSKSVHYRSCTSSTAVKLMDILTAYQHSSRLEIVLHALMPTPVQLSTVGQPFIQGDDKLHAIEVPFRLWGAHRKAIPLRHVSQIHNSQLLSGRANLAIFQTLVYMLDMKYDWIPFSQTTPGPHCPSSSTWVKKQFLVKNKRKGLEAVVTTEQKYS